jgi:UDP-glucose 6-dehydrogenase
MVKYACNAYHALKVGFANEIAELCDALGADGQEVMRVVCEDRKLNVSPAYLRPGFAFGGSCLPKDLRALLYVGRVNDVPVPLLSGLVTSNDSLIRRGVEAVLRTRRRRIGMVGLAFKPTSDDLRESPMVALAEALIGKAVTFASTIRRSSSRRCAARTGATSSPRFPISGRCSAMTWRRSSRTRRFSSSGPPGTMLRASGSPPATARLST